MEHKLKNRYISVNTGTAVTYGGSQLMSESEAMRKCGCGVIACCDLLLYLSSVTRCSFPVSSTELEKDDYNKLSAFLCRRFFPIIPPFGMTGINLAAGLNICFHKFGLPYRAVWKVGKASIFANMEKMLDEDIPVIFSVGPNFPFFWKNKRIILYKKTSPGSFSPAYSAKAHYMTVTGIDEEWICLSSWGKQLFLKRSDYIEYISDSSNSLVSNIAYIERK